MFSQVPFAALIVGAIASAIVCRHVTNGSDALMPDAWTATRASVFIAFAVVTVEHVLLLAAPHAVL